MEVEQQHATPMTFFRWEQHDTRQPCGWGGRVAVFYTKDKLKAQLWHERIHPIRWKVSHAFVFLLNLILFYYTDRSREAGGRGGVGCQSENKSKLGWMRRRLAFYSSAPLLLNHFPIIPYYTKRVMEALVACSDFNRLINGNVNGNPASSATWLAGVVLSSPLSMETGWGWMDCIPNQKTNWYWVGGMSLKQQKTGLDGFHIFLVSAVWVRLLPEVTSQETNSETKQTANRQPVSHQWTLNELWRLRLHAATSIGWSMVM